MGFERNDYLGWYIPRMFGEPAINLHSSGVPALTPADIEIPDVDPWQASTLFEEALASWLSIPADEVLFTPGATGGTLLALMTLTSPGDHVLVEKPVYEPMLRQALRLGEVQRFGRIPTSWRLVLDEVASLMTERTSLVMITEPSNPSGTFLPREQVLALADMCASRSALLLVNEVYRGYSDAPSFHGESDSIVVVSSLSKLLGAYWARLGWVSARPGIVERLRAAHRNMSMPTAPGAACGLGVMRRADELRANALRLSASGVEAVDAWVESTPGLSWTRPEGPGFGCVHLPEDIDDDVGFAERLHGEQGVLVVPGTHFEVPGALRISWLQSGDHLVSGLERIGRAL
jgi:aspartate/methionine/tyrosine aminotransferase